MPRPRISRLSLVVAALAGGCAAGALSLCQVIDGEPVNCAPLDGSSDDDGTDTTYPDLPTPGTTDETGVDPTYAGRAKPALRSALAAFAARVDPRELDTANSTTAPNSLSPLNARLFVAQLATQRNYGRIGGGPQPLIFRNGWGRLQRYGAILRDTLTRKNQMLAQRDDEIAKKLTDIRERLLADPDTEELQRMHLTMDALSKWATLSQMRRDETVIDTSVWGQEP